MLVTEEEYQRRKKAARSLPEPGLHDPSEEWWAGHFVFLKERGYMMRPRYRPDWKPSYTLDYSDRYLDFEDGQKSVHPYVMDAVRLSDSRVVAMKHVSRLPIVKIYLLAVKPLVATLFSNDEHNSNEHNHCIRILEVLPVPGNDEEKILIMPWMRKVEDPKFRTIGEVLQFFKEMIEGIHYMHRNNVAHRDCSINNMAVDAGLMYPNGYHPIATKKNYNWHGKARHNSRTRYPPKYYLIDFEYSQIYEPAQPRPLEEALKSGGYDAPEGLAGTPCDPFATDVFILGNMMKTSFIRCEFLGDREPNIPHPKIYGLDFLRPLVNDMVADDPSKRPTMDEVVPRFHDAIKRLPWWKLRSRAVSEDEFVVFKPYRALDHLLWTAAMIILRKPGFHPQTLLINLVTLAYILTILLCLNAVCFLWIRSSSCSMPIHVRLFSTSYL
ncbi:hypothetical protein BT96DRAFT_811501 [Gymnopus androsaceus JB14]|uniref:Protein kinase domain-containing protein n=1 Tax=Gymnopus androsaceus JB14 TaxID=1447944 RepID=A0A6A4I2C7_9AGAR|nr:hypothetical protein BT96DRAFT_811501 [Gymnopus androsaceus JB14]